MSFDDLYRQNILDHYQNPRNFGTLPKPDISVEDSNPLCGDKIRMDLSIEDGRVTDVRFSGVGCSISRAAASMLTEEIKMLGIELGPVRLKCALLALKTLKVGVYGIRGWNGEAEE
jgi:nitrogen fixation NifU-like protein